MSELPLVHVGLAKTGSTYLQRVIFPAISGIAYHGKGSASPRMAEAMLGVTRRPSTQFDAPGARRAFAAIPALRPGERLVLSDEDLSVYKFLDPEHMAGRLRRLLGPCDVLLVTRDPLDWVRSQYYFRLSTLRPDTLDGLDPWIDHHIRIAGVGGDLSELRVNRLLAALTEAYGGDLHAISYELLRDEPRAFSARLAGVLRVPEESVDRAFSDPSNPRIRKDRISEARVDLLREARHLRDGRGEEFFGRVFDRLSSLELLPEETALLAGLRGRTLADAGPDFLDLVNRLDRRGLLAGPRADEEPSERNTARILSVVEADGVRPRDEEPDPGTGPVAPQRLSLFREALQAALAAGMSREAMEEVSRVGREHGLLEAADLRAFSIQSRLPMSVLADCGLATWTTDDQCEVREAYEGGERSVGPSHHVGGLPVVPSVGRVSKPYPAVQVVMVNDADVWTANHQTQVWTSRGRVSGVGFANTSYLRPMIESEEGIRLSGLTLDVTTTSGALFSHFLMDSLPKFAAAQRAGIEVGDLDHVIVNELRSPFQLEALTRVGVRPEQIVERGRGSTRFLCERLAVIDRVRGGWVAGDWLYQWVQSLAPQGEGAGSRIFIPRGDGARRALRNEGQIIERLLPLGFRIVDPSTSGLFATMASLVDAEIVVGPHGAGLANIVASRRLKALVELHGPHCAVEALTTSTAMGARHFTVGSVEGYVNEPASGELQAFLNRNMADYDIDPQMVIEAVTLAEAEGD